MMAPVGSVVVPRRSPELVFCARHTPPPPISSPPTRGRVSRVHRIPFLMQLPPEPLTIAAAWPQRLVTSPALCRLRMLQVAQSQETLKTNGCVDEFLPRISCAEGLKHYKRTTVKSFLWS